MNDSAACHRHLEQAAAGGAGCGELFSSLQTVTVCLLLRVYHQQAAVVAVLCECT